MPVLVDLHRQSGRGTDRGAFLQRRAGLFQHDVQSRDSHAHARRIKPGGATVPVAVDQRAFAHGLAHQPQPRDVSLPVVVRAQLDLELRDPLGLRLARRGYRTELVATETREEPNSRPVAWIRQRSRWQKGYAITWASHMRDPARLWRDLGPKRFLGVQILFLGTLSQAILAPVLWSFWLVALGLPHPLTGLLPQGAFTALGTLFLASEVTGIGVGLWATRGPQHRHLMKWVPTLHAYFPLASVSAYRALLECATRPFHWEKTAHGIVAARPEAPELLPVLLLTDPVQLLAGPPAGAVPLHAAPREVPRRLHLAPAAPFPDRAPEDAAAPLPRGRPSLVLIEGGPDAVLPRAPYILGTVIASAPRNPGIEFQPRFEGF